MLRSLNDLERYKVSATDGDIIVDDETREVRYLVIKNSPEWDANAAVNREYETRLYDYYGRPAYWADTARPGAPQLAHHSGRPE